MRGVTILFVCQIMTYSFQPTLPMRGVTQHYLDNLSHHRQFQPTLPMRGVTSDPVLTDHRVVFQPTLPMRGVTDTSPDRL